MSKQDLIGSVFGKLKVDRFSHEKIREMKNTPYSERHFYWICKCECGNEITCDQYCLISGNTKSCGCSRKKYNLEGKSFGDWNVLSSAVSRKDKNGKKETMWLCKCICGNQKEISTSSLIRKQSTKCLECCKKERYKGFKEISGKYWSSLKKGAEVRNLLFEIEIQYAWGLFIKQNSKCALSGVKLKFSTKMTASLDRIDNNKGYIAGNIQWVHKNINRLKNNFQEDYLLKMCKAIYKNDYNLRKNSKNTLNNLSKHILVDGFPIVLDLKRSFGSWIIDAATKKKYLDCFGGFGSQALGWNWPTLINKIEELGSISLSKVTHSDIYTEYYDKFVKKLSETMGNEFTNLFFISGGTLAVENGLKAAFDWKTQLLGIQNDQQTINDLDVIHFENAFHGRSGYALSITNTDHNKTKWFPKFPWTRVPINDSGLELVEKTLKNNKVSAVIIEPILGEGGDIHVSKEFLLNLRDLTSKYESLLIFDEVQTGFSTGKAWCHQHFDIIPDIFIFGKKIQVCGIASTKRIHEVTNNVFTTPSRINSTWGPDIVDIVRSTIILETIENEKLLENSTVVGDYFLNQLKSLSLLNVRGKGMMLAFDLPNNEERDKTYNKLLNKMLCLKCGKKSIRFRPHLTFTKDNVDEAIEIIKESV